MNAMVPGMRQLPPDTQALADAQGWPTYRLALGGHEEKLLPEQRDPDGSLKSLRFKMGDVFRSPLNLLAHNRNGHVKFELLYGPGQFQEGNNPNQATWDMTRETLEQFNERMKARLASGAGPVGVTAVAPQQFSAAPAVAAPPQEAAVVTGLPTHAAVDLADHDERKLRAIAAEEEVDVSRCKTKADLVGTLRKALGAKVR